MSSQITPSFERTQGAVLTSRLAEPRRFVQAVTGPRQVGKTTLVQQVVSALAVPHVFVSADEPTLRDSAWLASQWERARVMAGDAGSTGAVLVLDEVQKLPHWSESVKRLWDEDTRRRVPLRVVLLGSSPLLVQRGLTESLAGRFETIHLPHWSFSEMRAAFGYSLDEFIYFGGYPGAAALRHDLERWRRYILDSLIETSISRDVLLQTRVDKPALLRRLFELGCRHSGQILAYTKMLGQLHDAGNTTTLAHYLELLAGAGMVTGLQKYSGRAVRVRGSSPKLQVFNTALMTAATGISPEEWRADSALYGRLVESAVGAHLVNGAAAGECEVYYWRESDREVDFVVTGRRKVVGLEVKSGRVRAGTSALDEFGRAFGTTRLLRIGGDGVPVEELLERSVAGGPVRISVCEAGCAFTRGR